MNSEREFLNADAMTVKNNTVSSNVTKMGSTININDCIGTTVSAQPFGIDSWGPYVGTCPHCGSNNIEANYGIVLASMPPQYNCRCKDCKGTFFSGQIKQESQTITPYLPDPGLPNYPNQPQRPNYGYGMREGWICPRCGKVNSPDRDFCDCGNGGWNSPIVWCNQDSSGNNPNSYQSTTICSNIKDVSTGYDTTLCAQGCDNCVKAKTMKEELLKNSDSVFDALHDYSNFIDDCKSRQINKKVKN